MAVTVPEKERGVRASIKYREWMHASKQGHRYDREGSREDHLTNQGIATSSRFHVLNDAVEDEGERHNMYENVKPHYGGVSTS